MISTFLKAFPKKIASHRTLSGERGMATGVVIILAGLMAAIALSMIGLNREMNLRDLRYMHFINSLDIIHSNLYAFGQNNYAFDASLAKNNAVGKMTCIRDQIDCNTAADFSGAEPVILAWPNGTIYYNFADSTKTAFTLKGEPCGTAYSATTVTNGCLLRVQLKWSPFCNNLPCKVSRDGPNRMVFMVEYSVPQYYTGTVLISNSFLPVNLGSYEGEANVPAGPLNGMSRFR